MDIPLAKPVVDESMRSEADRVLQEEFFLRGETVEQFEREYAEYIGTEEAVAVSSGTDALHLSLRALGISKGDTVLTSPATFISTANAAKMAGAESIFVDIEMETYGLNLNQVKQTIEEQQIDAIIPVHLYGYPIAIDELKKIAGEIPIISDSCQAHGAQYRGQRVGSHADVGTFSFYPSKNMTVAGDGGMVVTDDAAVADMVQSLRDVGRGKGDYNHPRIGYTSRMDTFKAAIGRIQLERLDAWNDRRREVAKRYSEEFADIDDFVLPPTGSDEVEPAWYLYVVRTDRRDELASFLEDRGVETGIHYGKPVHLQPPYREQGHTEGDFPSAERWAQEVLSLPIHPHLTENEVEYVIEAVNDFFAS